MPTFTSIPIPTPNMTARTNPFAAMSHTKPVSSTSGGFFKLMSSPRVSAAASLPNVASCEDCDRSIELSSFAGVESEGRCGRCYKWVCDSGCSIFLGDGVRVCLDCAMRG